MMPRQTIRSSTPGLSVFGFGVELIDHANRQADLAFEGLLLGCLSPREPRLESNAVVHLVEKRGIAALAFDFVLFDGPARRRAARATRRLRRRLAGLLPGPPRLAPRPTRLGNLPCPKALP